jgi:outer membrane protein OmpA-like peptidoglycan-associated protein
MPQEVPIYRVTVTERTVKAINYQYRNGPTPIDFRGTVLLPESKGDATVESKAGRTEIDAHIEHLAAPTRFGREYLTYVLWAITPEGHPKNLGELLAGSSDKAHVRVTTDLQAFGLIVTAEPYAAVRQPSDVVVMENQVRPDTIGNIEPIQVRYELMPRHGYTYNIPVDLNAANGNGPMVSMGEYETTLEVYQALNAVQIAQAAGAGQYAPDVMGKAEQQLRNAQSLQAQKVDKSLVIMAAREAAQTAEDARALAAQRARDAELAQAHAAAAQEQQLRLAAELQARQAEAQAAQAQTQAVQAQTQAVQAQTQAAQAQAQASADRMQLEAVQQAQAVMPPAAPPVVVINPETILAPAPVRDDRQQRDLRVNLLQQINGYFPARDTPQGLVITISDFDFHGVALDAAINPRIETMAALVAAHPGLSIEVDGFSDSAAPEAERIASVRAGMVRDTLMRAGLSYNAVSLRSLGNSRPLGSNATAQGREMNRRVEVVISGAPIGYLASWDKSYPVVPR